MYAADETAVWLDRWVKTGFGKGCKGSKNWEKNSSFIGICAYTYKIENSGWL